jgi:hypothetical protein
MMKRAAAALLFVALLAGFGVGKATAGDGKVTVRIPVCQEDEQYLKGKGDFDGERWSRYVCIHPDNL